MYVSFLLLPFPMTSGYVKPYIVCTLSVPILYHPQKGLQTEPYKIKNPKMEKVPKYTGLRRSVQNHLETSLQSPQ